MFILYFIQKFISKTICFLNIVKFREDFDYYNSEEKAVNKKSCLIKEEFL